MNCVGKLGTLMNLHKYKPKFQIFPFSRTLSVLLLALATLFAAQSALAQTVIYQDDFESGTSGWSSNTTENAPMIGTNILGRFGGPTPQVSRTFTVPAGATALEIEFDLLRLCLLYTSPSPRDQRGSRMPSSA